LVWLSFPPYLLPVHDFIIKSSVPGYHNLLRSIDANRCPLHSYMTFQILHLLLLDITIIVFSLLLIDLIGLHIRHQR
jgi:hypothetical protein